MHIQCPWMTLKTDSCVCHWNFQKKPDKEHRESALHFPLSLKQKGFATWYAYGVIVQMLSIHKFYYKIKECVGIKYGIGCFLLCHFVSMEIYLTRWMLYWEQWCIELKCLPLSGQFWVALFKMKSTIKARRRPDWPSKSFCTSLICNT